MLTEQDGDVLVITLDRPQARNAVDAATSAEIAAAMDRLDGDDGLAVGVLAASGSTFCAGMDLKAFLRGEIPEVAGRGFGGLTQAPPTKPLVAAVEGPAVAGGFELVLACDLVVASTAARFGLPEVTLGLIAGSGGLIRLPQRVPRQVAMRAALTGDPISAEEALRWGLVNELTAPGEALPVALALAHRVAANGPLAVRTTKQVLDQAPTWPTDEVWARQEELLELVRSSDDAREGATAFAEKREPRWQGR